MKNKEPNKSKTPFLFKAIADKGNFLKSKVN